MNTAIHSVLILKRIMALIVFVAIVSARKHRQFVHRTPIGHTATPPNILLILADDLGYGDTDVPPFMGLGIKTPGLERMAAKGMKLTNYHTAAATCTPTRASILTGMYPWRMGIKSVFEYGKPDGKSNRNDWLTPVPTIPMVLREANYSVSHSGKWHLGGMRNDDYDMRTLPIKPEGTPGGRRCPHPGPNQQGFKSYVSVLDGPGSPRQNRLQLNNQLYSQGCTALLHNDVDIGGGQSNITGYLSFCEAQHAMLAMNRSVARGKPFYVQLWFHAPHSPLEEIPGWHIKLNGPNATRNLDNNDKFRTMVADMDHQIGLILDNLKYLGIEKNTLVVFTSDNGPEPFAGSRAGLKGAKRYLYEGGIRVPAIVQWVGTVPAGTSTDAFVVSTDLFPTFLDAAGVLAPPHLRLDGLSFLPLIVPGYHKDHTPVGQSTATRPVITDGASNNNNNMDRKRNTDGSENEQRHMVDVIREDATLYANVMRDRVTLWHNDYEGERRTAAWLYGYKAILDANERILELYDVQTDKFEAKNILPREVKKNNKILSGVFISAVPADIALSGTIPHYTPTGKGPVTLDMILNDRNNRDVHILIASRLYAVMRDYVKYGNSAHILQLAANPGWNYRATVRSEYRADHIKNRQNEGAIRLALINGTCEATPCGCEVKTVSDVRSLPFENTPAAITYLHPGKLWNGAHLLEL